MDFFKSTPIRQWSKEKIREYFNNKNIHLTDVQLHSGATLTSARLSTLRRIYGIALGERIYIVLRDRIEREEDIIYKKYSGSPNFIGTPLGSILSESTNENLVMSDIELGSPLCKPSRLACIPPPQLSLESHRAPINKKETDSSFIVPSKPRENALDRKIDDYLYKQFINKYPPLLWQQYHLQYLLRSLGLDPDISIHVDDFIFLSEDELEFLYPNNGDKLFTAIRSKFINPNIRKLEKKLIVKILD